MQPNSTYGTMNGEAIGVIIKEAVRRAITAISKQRFVHEAVAKEDEFRPNVADFVTSADTAAQEIYVRLIRSCFPGFGIVAEEDHLAEPCTRQDMDAWFTIDPLDGTKAFIRRQSHGIGTMISLVTNSEIVSAFVGDVLTREIYGYRPGSENVHRISEFENRMRLEIDSTRPLSDQWVLLRDDPHLYSPFLQKLLPAAGNPRFKGTEVTGGSIGISMARLWKSEVGAAVLHAGPQKPWDILPVYGISRKLGFRFLLIDGDKGPVGEWQPLIAPNVQRISHEVLIVHESRLDEVASWTKL